MKINTTSYNTREKDKNSQKMLNFTILGKETTIIRSDIYDESHGLKLQMF